MFNRAMYWIKQHLLPSDSWWLNMPYGTGLEGAWRQHIPSHVLQGNYLYWFFMLIAPLRPYAWLMALAVSAYRESDQRERWRRDKDGVVVMKWVENVWDLIIVLAGASVGVWGWVPSVVLTVVTWTWIALRWKGKV